MDINRNDLEDKIDVTQDIVATRKELYDQYIKNNKEVTTDVINQMYLACVHDHKSPRKYTTPFYRAAMKFYKSDEKKNAIEILKWIDLLDIDYIKSLNKIESQTYSEYDLCIMRKVKALCNLSMFPDAITILDDYKIFDVRKVLENEALLWMSYTVCKYLFEIGDFINAEVYLDDILRVRRDIYILEVPIKHYDTHHPFKGLVYLLEILVRSIDIDFYFYNRSLKYLSLMNIGIEDLSYLKDKPSSDQVFQLKKAIINYLESHFIEEKIVQHLSDLQSD